MNTKFRIKKAETYGGEILYYPEYFKPHIGEWLRVDLYYKSYDRALRALETFRKDHFKSEEHFYPFND